MSAINDWMLLIWASPAATHRHDGEFFKIAQ